MITDRIDAVTLVNDRYKSPVCPAPKSVKIEVSPRCNYRWGFCALRMREEQPGTDMDFGLFQRITTEMRAAGVEEIGVFYLGESFMNPALLVDCIAHCKALGFPYVFLTTNGSRSSPKWLREVFAAGLDSLKFSVNACDEEQFERVMGVKGSLFRQAIDNLQQAKAIRDEMGSDCGIYASSIQYDGGQQERMKAFLDAEVIPFLSISTIGFPCTASKANQLASSTGNRGVQRALSVPSV